MAYYYVKDDGTATGDNGRYASIQTSSFATLGTSGYYSDIYDAINTPTTAPISGDYILISDSSAGTPSYAGLVTLPDGVNLVSVSDTNCDTYSPGASEVCTNDFEVYPKNNCLLAGVSLGSANHGIYSNHNAVTFTVQDCTLTCGTGPADACLSVGADGMGINLINVTLDAGGISSYAIRQCCGSNLYMLGGSVTTTSGLYGLLGGNGGATALFKGVDLSNITDIYASAIPQTGHCIHIRFDECQLNSSLNFPTFSAGRLTQRLEFYNCDDSTGNAYHRFYILTPLGTAANNDTTYVTATESWYEGSDKSSIEVTTTSSCSHANPFGFELPAQYIDLSSASSDVLTIELVTDSTALSLTDTDIAAFLVYPDGTTAVQANLVTSGKTVGTGNYGIDPLAAGTALSASSLGAGDWTGEPASANFYKIELDTGGDAGQATVCSVRIEVYKASIASGDLFIHPIMTAS